MAYQTSFDRAPGPGVPQIFVEQAHDDARDGAVRYNNNTAIGTIPTWIQLPMYNQQTRLERQLRQYQVRHASGVNNQSFWPPGVLKALVTKEAIANELSQAIRGLDRDKASAIARQVWQDRSGPSIKVFTILLFLGKLDDFVYHIMGCRVGVRDHNLPLSLDTDPYGSVRLLHKDNTEASCCFDNWQDLLLEGFDTYQRRLTIPIFRLKKDDNTLIHLDLNARDILPWCEENTVAPVNAMSGGFGTVTRVRIHPLCHEFHDTLKAVSCIISLVPLSKIILNRIIDQCRRWPLRHQEIKATDSNRLSAGGHCS